MIEDKSLEQYADEISKLTFNMQKMCTAKEALFCATINLSPIQFRCLRYLLKTTFLQVKELADNMELTPSRITNLLNNLESKGYIQRKISNKDRRIIKVTLTKKGREYATEVREKYIKYHEEILSMLKDEEEIKSLFTNLKKFEQILDEFLENQKENLK
ncbi:MarR family winged helix-turn-helix transcriptional regulator [Sulfurospirillum sp. 1612]|uniref:MarR family winged helix-turn-helix transcriptional regulator n=1 Tax=Sulfurospirillum sp. 1612 TaxID=3094835 RepID=UPI002F949BAE